MLHVIALAQYAVTVGLFGTVPSTGIVVTAELAEIVAGAIAMGLGGYLAAKTDLEPCQSERRPGVRGDSHGAGGRRRYNVKGKSGKGAFLGSQQRLATECCFITRVAKPANAGTNRR